MRLLLAEDERELSAALQAVLKRNHYEVDAVYDGARPMTTFRLEITMVSYWM